MRKIKIVYRDEIGAILRIVDHDITFSDGKAYFSVFDVEHVVPVENICEIFV